METITLQLLPLHSEFKDKSKIEQHKIVYNSLKGKMGNELHALAIKTKE